MMTYQSSRLEGPSFSRPWRAGRLKLGPSGRTAYFANPSSA